VAEGVEAVPVALRRSLYNLDIGLCRPDGGERQGDTDRTIATEFSLPRYSRVEARYTVSTISIFSRNIHLPYRLRIIGVGYFHNL
jgi:hypothetical protein